ncbi:hypothetical protein LEN26_014447 [Aphanomyces euteiches]|nr:hypothetical protein LEN26_014447 [Aphanomyces euteiches]
MEATLTLQPLVPTPPLRHENSTAVTTRQDSPVVDKSPRAVKTMPTLKMIKHIGTNRQSSFSETSKVTKVHDAQGHKRLNQYILYDVIGQGAYGKVRKAYWPERDKYYAIKIINKKHVRKLARTARGPGGDGLDTIRKEFAIWKLLDHPNIVKLREVIDAPDSTKMYMVSELIDGGAVVDGETTCTSLLEEQARHFFCQLIDGIDFLHFHKIIHRDIKPSNLLCGADGVLKITDFGLSHVFEDEDDDYRQTVGTGPFLAPEMLTGEKFKGKPVDIWACGVTLYMFVYGCLPFQADRIPDLYEKIKNQTVQYPSTIAGESVDPNLINLLQGILKKSPSERLKSDQIRLHPWIRHVFEKSASVRVLEPVLLTPEIVQEAISPIRLYENLHKKIKAIAVIS